MLVNLPYLVYSANITHYNLYIINANEIKNMKLIIEIVGQPKHITTALNVRDAQSQWVDFRDGCNDTEMPIGNRELQDNPLVTDDNGKPILRFSYNARMWDCKTGLELHLVN